MSVRVEVNYWAEGPTDREVARRLIEQAGGTPGADYARRRGASPGKDYLDKKLVAFNAGARYAPWLVMRDSDRECPVEVVTRLLRGPEKWMRFRLVVPMVEAWLIADREAFARFLGVAASDLPRKPELLDQPKTTVIRLAESSRKRDVRADLLPKSHSGRTEGSGYAARLKEFIHEDWCPVRAARSAPSLARAMQRLTDLVAAWTCEY